MSQASSHQGLSQRASRKIPQSNPRAAIGTRNLVACSPDAKFYAFASADGHIRYARTEDGVALHTFYHCNPRAVAFSADGRFLASAGKSCGGQTKLKVWNVAEGTLICQMETHLGSDVLLSFSPDGKWLASTCARSCLDLWELPTGILKQSVRTPHAILRIAFSEQSQSVVIIGADGGSRAAGSIP